MLFENLCIVNCQYNKSILQQLWDEGILGKDYAVRVVHTASDASYDITLEDIPARSELETRARCKKINPT